MSSYCIIIMLSLQTNTAVISLSVHCALHSVVHRMGIVFARNRKRFQFLLMREYVQFRVS